MNSTSSCKYLLQYHLIFVVKYRKQLLVGDLSIDMLKYIKSLERDLVLTAIGRMLILGNRKMMKILLYVVIVVENLIVFGM